MAKPESNHDDTMSATVTTRTVAMLRLITWPSDGRCAAGLSTPVQSSPSARSPFTTVMVDGQRTPDTPRRNAMLSAGWTHLRTGYFNNGSRGRPRMRSPIWLRLISEVPPAIDMPRCISTSRLLMPPGPSMNNESGPLSSVMMAAAS